MIHLNKFLDRIRIEEQRNSKNFVMSLREAQDLHTDITKLLIVLQELTTKAPVTTTEPNNNNEIIQVQVNPGNKW